MRELFYKATHANWITEPKTDTQYAIEDEGNIRYVKFQWTQGLIDWLYNFDFFVKPYKQMQNIFFVHRGFLKKYKAVRDVILKASDTDKKIIVLGYSQGAALAVICHEDLVFHGKEPETYAFGTPRSFSIFGSKVLKQRLKGLTRIQNGNDIVTRLPFAIFLYRHYGYLIHIGKKRNWFRFSIKDHAEYLEVLDGE